MKSTLVRAAVALAIAVWPVSGQSRTPKGDLSKLAPQTRKDILALYSEDAVERANAAYRLGRAGSVAAVPYLAGLLGDPEKVTPEYASGRFKGLMAPVRVGEVAGEAMGEMNATGALLRALRDPNEAVATDALCGLTSPMSSQRVLLVLPLLSDSDPLVRRRAAGVLETLASEVQITAAIPALVAALKDPVAEVRAAAALALVGVSDPRAVAALPLLVKDKNPEVRRSAVQAAAEQNGNAAAAAIQEALLDSDVEVRRLAAAALAKRNAPQAVERLRQALSDSDSTVRRNAILALGRQRDRLAVDLLISALADREMPVREAAAQVLGAFGDARAIPHLLEIARKPGQEGAAGASALVGIGAAAVDTLLAALGGSDRELRRNVVWEGRLRVKDPRWLPAMIDAFRFNDADPTSWGANGTCDWECSWPGVGHYNGGSCCSDGRRMDVQHMDGVNVLFLDGHVKWTKGFDLITYPKGNANCLWDMQ